MLRPLVPPPLDSGLSSHSGHAWSHAPHGSQVHFFAFSLAQQEHLHVFFFCIFTYTLSNAYQEHFCIFTCPVWTFICSMGAPRSALQLDQTTFILRLMDSKWLQPGLRSYNSVNFILQCSYNYNFTLSATTMMPLWVKLETWQRSGGQSGRWSAGKVSRFMGFRRFTGLASRFDRDPAAHIEFMACTYRLGNWTCSDFLLQAG